MAEEGEAVESSWLRVGGLLWVWVWVVEEEMSVVEILRDLGWVGSVEADRCEFDWELEGKGAAAG